ncbi:hypothetical protein EGW08_002611 [Elysia chlorotica]|uniref:GPI ethanolamine phosphate transferase 1 n=1 Tax=Elysia chlorotica TaxID=188477 RepID=A0A3S1I039_ELYCH|nr:hypothetical protein EGW08_002611 [Elysia chlorotica]
MKVWQLVVVGIFVHIILFYSIFDIYFTSPLVHGMTPLTVPNQPPASRLILFVADGLRADKFFEPDENGRSRVPYLRRIIEEEGAWGVSHTRVPTESRPGHVALIAGFYEDVSAVAKGWKENPVDFDSVFNQSRHTWSWGSPDILPMFAKGASGDHVITNCYPADLEDFAGSDMTRLDTWVFDQVKDFFTTASDNKTLYSALQQDKIVMFLHLLGIDTHGHSNKPHSKDYLNNIRVVDKGIKDIVGVVNDFYKDKRTAFVLTADHGMTDWGSHGAGHPQETLTPFLAWGPGMRKPVVQEYCGNFEDTFCADWQLDSLRRSDMEQADIAPLMSYLIGIPLPVNSVGVLPIDVLDASDSQKAEALLLNAQQLLAQFQVKMTQIKQRTLSVTFRPFQELSEDYEAKAIKHIKNLIHSGRPQDAIFECRKLIQQALQGLRYYQTYDRFFLGMSIVMGFLGWMSYILHLIMAEHTSLGRQALAVSKAGVGPSQSVLDSMESVSLLSCAGTTLGRGILVAVCSTIGILLYVQSLPLMYYVYCLLPALLWFKSLQGWNMLWSAIKSLLHNNGCPWSLILSCLCCLAGLEIVVQSFYRRELLSLGLIAMSAWPIASYVNCVWIKTRPSLTTSALTRWGWSMSCLLVAVFPLLPVVGRNAQYSLVFASGSLVFIGGTIILYRLKVTIFSKRILTFQLFLVLTSVAVVAVTSWSISQKLGLPSLCQLTSWITLGVSTILPLLTGTCLEERLLSLSLSFFSIYLLMSITYEGFFLLSLLILLYFWMRMEIEMSNLHGQKSPQSFTVDLSQSVSTVTKDHNQDSRFMQMADLRRSIFYVFFIIIAFFGTGNIASINSFDPSSVYCFLTVFNPFIMGSLMMLKNLLPFLVVTCALRAVLICTQTPLRALFLLVLLMSDFMGLHFFFLVKDHGSWLEIGTTISHYVIVMGMIIFLLLLTGVSHALTCWRITWPTARSGLRKQQTRTKC